MQKKITKIKLQKKWGYSFDIKNRDLSIYDVFRTFWALLPRVLNQLVIFGDDKWNLDFCAELWELSETAL